ncbi:MAG TPA: tetratricopeptide repeat protein [Ideonella sp.]|nr:tetratricopeptide repeat protein [Ideonella sp.]
MKSMDLEAPEGPARVDALIEQAQRLRHEEPRAALTLCRQAHAIALRLDYQRGLAHSLMRGALCRFMLAEPAPGCLAELGQSVALFHTLGDRAGEAEASHLLANVQASHNHHAEALLHYHRSLQLRRELGDASGEAGTLNNIGSVLRATAQFAEALKYLFMSLELAEAAADARATACALGNIGAVLADLGDSRHAVEYHLRGLALIRLSHDGDRAIEGVMLTSLGRLLAQTGHTTEAVARLEQARDIAHRSGRQPETGAALLGLGLAWQQAGELERAERLLLEALLILRRSGNRRSEA